MHPADPRNTAIKPQRFRPPAHLSALPRWQLTWVPLAVLAALLLWGLAAWYVFTARAVTLLAVPANATLTVHAGLTPHLGSHWLLRPGGRRVVVSAPGYISYDDHIVVDSEAMQTHTVTLTRLPGDLRIALTPAIPAAVLIDNAAHGAAPGLIRGIAAGTRQIEIRAPRYRPHTTTIEIEGKGIEQRLAVVLEPAWAAFTVNSAPAGATISVDDRELGMTPFEHELLEGRRVLQITHRGYKPWQQTLKVVAGTAVKLGTVVLSKADGHLRIESTPPAASVTLDDAFVGQTPLEIAAAPERAHHVRVLAEGYEAAERDITLAAAATDKLAFALTPELAAIEFITQPAAAELLIDGAAYGTATQTVSLPTRAHEVVVRAHGYATYTTTVTPRKGAEKRYRIRLKTTAEAAAEASDPDAPAATNTAAGAAAQGAANGPAAALITTFAGQQLALFIGGRAVLGSSRSDSARQLDEVEREVTLQRPFYLGVKEVTNDEFRRFLAAHVSPPFRTLSLNDDQQPVTEVDWRMAALYCNWLSRRDGLPLFYQIKYGEVLGVNPDATGYRLPTEAEWEWAARVPPASAATRFAWGDRYPPQGRSDNFADMAAAKLINGTLRNYNDGFAVAAPVGSFSANLRGLYDMGGNVAEWVHDYYEATPASTPSTDPLGPPTGSRHVIKGASWAQSSETELRLAYRDSGESGRNDVGFRLARYAQ